MWDSLLVRLVGSPRRQSRRTGQLSEAARNGAHRFSRNTDRSFRFTSGTAEAMPFEDESFDIVFSEYGASIWCDPYLWIPEAARVLRPGGQLAFLANSALVMLCSPDAAEPTGERLLRPYFGMHRFEWSTDDSVEFHLPHGEWIRLLRETGFEVEALIEVQAPEDANPHRYTGLPTVEWARRWPSEEIWKARKAR